MIVDEDQGGSWGAEGPFRNWAELRGKVGYKRKFAGASGSPRPFLASLIRDEHYLVAFPPRSQRARKSSMFLGV